MIDVIFADILKQDVDAIVNPANHHMLHGGGLAAIIAHAGGPEVVRESQEQAPIKTGEAIITTAGRLPFKNVIHTVGPYWGGGDNEPYWRGNNAEDTEDADELLRRAHFSALKLAHEHDLTSVAFPAVSCGVFRFPVERAAPIAVDAVSEALTEYSSVVRVVFCLLDDTHFMAFDAARWALEEQRALEALEE